MASLARIAFVTAVIAIIGAALVTGWADLTGQASLHSYATLVGLMAAATLALDGFLFAVTTNDPQADR